MNHVPKTASRAEFFSSLLMLGAERVFSLDFEKGRLALAREAGAETIDLSEQDSGLLPVSWTRR